jgi:hypothetical protein
LGRGVAVTARSGVHIYPGVGGADWAGIGWRTNGEIGVAEALRLDDGFGGGNAAAGAEDDAAAVRQSILDFDR